jgi:hypothetical protein
MEIPYNALAGGLLIGGASVLLLSLAGRVAGVSGIIWGAVFDKASHLWRWLFLAGLMAGAALAHSVFHVPLPTASRLPTGMALAAGLLVGLGVKLGNGCTSGHGVCGVGRLAPRSIVASAVFFVFAVLTTYVVRHVWEVF